MNTSKACFAYFSPWRWKVVNTFGWSVHPQVWKSLRSHPQLDTTLFQPRSQCRRSDRQDRSHLPPCIPAGSVDSPLLLCCSKLHWVLWASYHFSTVNHHGKALKVAERRYNCFTNVSMFLPSILRTFNLAKQYYKVFTTWTGTLSQRLFLWPPPLKFRHRHLTCPFLSPNVSGSCDFSPTRTGNFLFYPRLSLLESQTTPFSFCPQSGFRPRQQSSDWNLPSS